METQLALQRLEHLIVRQGERLDSIEERRDEQHRENATKADATNAYLDKLNSKTQAAFIKLAEHEAGAHSLRDRIEAVSVDLHARIDRWMGRDSPKPEGSADQTPVRAMHVRWLIAAVGLGATVAWWLFTVVYFRPTAPPH